MFIGGVLIAAGMQLHLASGDYVHDIGTIRFTIERIVCADPHWITFDGDIQPSDTRPWEARRVVVRVTALKRSLALL